MAKPTTVKIRLNSSADTGHFYVTKKNARTMTDKMVVKKYDPVVRKHVEYKEGKIKQKAAKSGFLPKNNIYIYSLFPMKLNKNRNNWGECYLKRPNHLFSQIAHKKTPQS